jgi:hypothetical protein
MSHRELHLSCFARWRTALALLVTAGLACSGAQAIAIAAPSASTPPPPVAAREFVRRLAAAGRAEAALVRRFVDPLRGTPVAMHGRLVIEPPDRVRLEFTETGERVTLRGDGGEWLQPQMEQLVRFDATGAMGALRWWTLFGEVTGTAARERRVGPREWVVTMPDAGVAGDSARILLGEEGLPRRLVISEPAGGPVEYELSGWRFSKPRGRAEFVLEAPRGFQVFDLR